MPLFVKSVAIKSSLFFLLMNFFLFAAQTKPPILFLKSQINYAWGFIHAGWLIDSSGTVRSFHFTNADTLQYYNPDTLLLEKSVPTGKKIPVDTLEMMRALIAPAAKGTLTFGVACADAGTTQYCGFMNDSLTATVIKVICYQAGDEWACNSSLEARKIARWLISLDSLPMTACTPPDSCLSPSGVARNTQSHPFRKTNIPSSATFYLNGKKAGNSGNLVRVGKNGKANLDLKVPAK